MTDRMNIRLFLSSGHLSPEACRFYVSGALREDFVMLVDEHLSQCAFCRQAISGLMSSQNPEALLDSLDVLNVKMKNRTRELSSDPSISGATRQGIRWAWVSAAAVVLIGLVFSFYFFKYESFAFRLNLAKGYEDIPRDVSLLPQPPPPSDFAVLSDTFPETQEIQHAPRLIANEVPILAVEDDHSELVEIAIDMAKAADHAPSPAPAMATTDKETVDDTDMFLEREAGQVRTTTIQGVALESGNRIVRNKKQESASEEIFTMVEQMPVFPEGTEGLQYFLTKNLRIPADTSLTPGRVVVSFVIDEKGRVRDAEILKSFRKDIDQEVLRVVKKMPNWNPGKQGNQTVRVRMTLPVEISPPHD